MLIFLSIGSSLSVVFRRWVSTNRSLGAGRPDTNVTLASGILSFIFLPKSPHRTNRLCGGLVPVRGWLSEREADVFVARILRRDPKKGQATSMNITLEDM
jgi:hypothetical protein